MNHDANTLPICINSHFNNRYSKVHFLNFASILEKADNPFFVSLL